MNGTREWFYCAQRKSRFLPAFSFAQKILKNFKKSIDKQIYPCYNLIVIITKVKSLQSKEVLL